MPACMHMRSCVVMIDASSYKNHRHSTLTLIGYIRTSNTRICMILCTYIRYDIYSWTAGACGAQCGHLITNKNHIRVRICSFCNETNHTPVYHPNPPNHLVGLIIN